MMMARPYLLYICLGLLTALNGCIWFLAAKPDTREITVSFLDIGQGDAILIVGPTGIEVLIDGGPDRSVLRQLPRELGLFDRSIDVVIATHPDKDHIAGLVEVFKRYSVQYYLPPGVLGDTSYAEALEDAAREEPGLVQLPARRGMRLHLGDGAYADILFPDRDVANVETNDGSTALRVVYGETSFLMAGDLATDIEDYLVALDGEGLTSDVLKASHHGSKHSTSGAWLAAVAPSIVVISAGRGNTYGHPAPEVLERVRAQGARIVSTMEESTVTLVSDGRAVRQK